MNLSYDNLFITKKDGHTKELLKSSYECWDTFGTKLFIGSSVGQFEVFPLKIISLTPVIYVAVSFILPLALCTFVITIETLNRHDRRTLHRVKSETRSAVQRVNRSVEKSRKTGPQSTAGRAF